MVCRGSLIASSCYNTSTLCIVILHVHVHASMNCLLVMNNVIRLNWILIFVIGAQQFLHTFENLGIVSMSYKCSHLFLKKIFNKFLIMLNLQVHLLTFYMLFFYFSENYKQYNFSCHLTMLMSECHIENICTCIWNLVGLKKKRASVSALF